MIIAMSSPSGTTSLETKCEPDMATCEADLTIRKTGRNYRLLGDATSFKQQVDGQGDVMIPHCLSIGKLVDSGRGL